VAHYFKERISEQMSYVAPSAGVEIIDTKNLVTFAKKPFAQMRTNKTCTTGDKNAFA
jgi:hypothetical protein